MELVHHDHRLIDLMDEFGHFHSDLLSDDFDDHLVEITRMRPKERKVALAAMPPDERAVTMTRMRARKMAVSNWLGDIMHQWFIAGYDAGIQRYQTLRIIKDHLDERTKKDVQVKVQENVFDGPGQPGDYSFDMPKLPRTLFVYNGACTIHFRFWY